MTSNLDGPKLSFIVKLITQVYYVPKFLEGFKENLKFTCSWSELLGVWEPGLYLVSLQSAGYGVMSSPCDTDLVLVS